jgi:hypothetical protein
VAFDADGAVEQFSAATRMLQRRRQGRFRSAAGMCRVRGSIQPAADVGCLREPVGMQFKAAEIGEPVFRKHIHVGMQPKSRVRMSRTQGVGPRFGQTSMVLRYELNVIGRQRPPKGFVNRLAQPTGRRFVTQARPAGK